MVLAQLSEEDSDSNKKEGEMVRELPLKVKPLPTEEGEEGEEEVSKEELKKKKEEEENAKRINEVVNAVKDLKSTLADFLWLAYKMKLSEDELKELTNKVLDLIASYVTDITVDRIRSFSGDELEVREVKK